MNQTSTNKALVFTIIALVAAVLVGAVVFLLRDPSGRNAGTQQIVFISRRDFPKASTTNESAIYIMNSDGTEQERLTDGAAEFSNPSWSYDGKRIVFVLKEDVYAMDGDGVDRLKLATRGAFPQWSPDGKQIIFTRQTALRNYELFITDAEGQNIRRLAEGHVTQFHWSPDGKAIAYAQGRSGPADKASIHIVYPADNTDIVLPLPDSGDANSPCWSPDGKNIVFGSFTGEEQGELFIYDVTSKKIEKLTIPDKIGAWCYQPVWSPDGQYIAFSAKGDAPWHVNDTPVNIALIKADGTGAKQLTNLKKSQFASDVSWAEKQLLFTITSIKTKGDKKEAAADIYVVGLDGKQKQLTKTGRDYSPDFPD